MKRVETNLKEAVILEPAVFGDTRGYFYESYNSEKYAALGIHARFVQSNVSRSARGVLRGLHYQWPNPQGKLVSVLEGEVYDVAVDIRRGSPTFGQWASVMLTADNKRHFWIPEGFAHGFLVLSESAHVLYKTTDFYHPAGERCIRWDDSTLAIDWPLNAVDNVLLSPKDEHGMSFMKAELPPVGEPVPH